jgi:hypothetical protein
VVSAKKRWVVRVYWESTMPDHEASRVRDRLHGYSTVVGRHPIDRIWEATLSVQVPTLEDAATVASDLVAEATRLTPIGAEVLREHVVHPGIHRLPRARPTG